MRVGGVGAQAPWALALPLGRAESSAVLGISQLAQRLWMIISMKIKRKAS